ncbi:MAG: hypothetical protein HQL28_00305 [Candidatus Omnitrophica bacterium]|nr:hypothetical protein [Candidatus Omnitrophota bacterium]
MRKLNLLELVPKKNGKFPAIPLILVVILVIFAINAESAAVFCINHFTGYRVRYSRKDGTIFNAVKFRNFVIGYPKKKIDVKTESLSLDIDWKQTLKSKKLSVDVRLSGVDILNRYAELQKGLPMGLNLNNPLVTDWEYGTVNFRLLLGRQNIIIRNLRATSASATVRGEIERNWGNGSYSVHAYVALAPDLTKKLLGDLSDNVLVKQDDGWYGVNVNLAGNTGKKAFSLKSDLLDIKINERK